MLLTALLENTTARPELKTAHGLSLYITAAGHRFLFDFGPGAQFAQNADTLGVDLETVEFGILSHGHYDHGGGLDVFLRRCRAAPVYARPEVFRYHHTGDRDIGLSAGLEKAPCWQFTQGDETLYPGLRLLSQPEGRALIARDNAALLEDGRSDPFCHEQSLLITEGDTMTLIGGCAHRGIVNYLEQVKALTGRYPDNAVSGFHLATPGQQPEREQVSALAERLLEIPTRCYTCHCTGLPGWALLKARLGDKLAYLACGDTVTL